MAAVDSGPYFEDFVVGQKISHPQGRTITDADNIWFTLLTNNTNQIHFNKDYAEKFFSRPPFDGKLVVNFTFVFAVVLGVSVSETSKNGIMLGLDNLTVTNPTFAGDTLYAETEVIAKRESKSHDTMGLVTVLTRGLNQNHKKVLEFERTFMILKRGKTWS